MAITSCTMSRNEKQDTGRQGLEMTKAKESREKASKDTALEMIGLTRSSSQEVADGYGPSIQKSELIADARSQGYRAVSVRDIVEPATINLEERDDIVDSG